MAKHASRNGLIRVKTLVQRRRGPDGRKHKYHCARLVIPLLDGSSITVCARVSEDEARDAIRRASRGRGQDEVAGLFGSIGKAIGSVAKSSSLVKVASFANQVAQSPVGKALIPPQVSAAIGAVNIAGKLVQSARGGNPTAQTIVSHAQRMAARPSVYSAPVLSRSHTTVRATPTAQRPLPYASPGANATFRYLMTLSRA